MASIKRVESFQLPPLIPDMGDAMLTFTMDVAVEAAPPAESTATHDVPVDKPAIRPDIRKRSISPNDYAKSSDFPQLPFFIPVEQEDRNKRTDARVAQSSSSEKRKESSNQDQRINSAEQKAIRSSQLIEDLNKLSNSLGTNQPFSMIEVIENCKMAPPEQTPGDLVPPIASMPSFDPSDPFNDIPGTGFDYPNTGLAMCSIQ